MYDFMKRFCDIAEKGAREDNPLTLSRLIGQLEILAEICSNNYKLEGLCEMLANEMLKLQEKLDGLVQPQTITSAPVAVSNVKTIYKQEYVRCGKTNCTKCANRQGHGPYWYSYNFTGGQSRKRYIGLKLPEDITVDRANVRYAIPLATVPCHPQCQLEDGELKEPCCRNEHSEN
ncbi:MAG: hypothetical protein HXX08_10915 [Chloroflexi bacterium]|uniref:DUF6788 domain-containing protein n=1 Tax=Candidatus Chlorohelix allophototropha TaxID=3003348 RepID=A0A8T7LWJ7_9CHLR|nr:hypothetical protein [Chloroflexota bacterium]WJW65749.1 hypothetical protein OZ401_001527 [Chloroflexota bacterium L227-S17]